MLWLDLPEAANDLAPISTRTKTRLAFLGAVFSKVILGVADVAGLLGSIRAFSGDVILFAALSAGTLLAIRTFPSHVIFCTTVAASLLLAIGAILGNVILGFADSTCSATFLALLSAVTNTMSLFSAEIASDDELLSDHLLLGAILGLVAYLLAIAT